MKRFQKNLEMEFAAALTLIKTFFIQNSRFLFSPAKRKNLFPHEFQIQTDCNVLQQICNF